jgi:flagellar motor protein MotB
LSLRTTRLCIALATGALALSQASACVEVEPRHNVEFLDGSAELSLEQRIKLLEILHHADRSLSTYRVSVRGYADKPAGFEAAAWKSEDIALADARAQAVSLAMRESGAVNCVERIALGSAPEDPPAERVDEAGQHWHARTVIVLAAQDSHDTPMAGVKVETDCGPPAPPRPAKP